MTAPVSQCQEPPTSFSRPSSRSSDISGINVTPLIDVMLCLLVIFLISAPVLAERVPLDLPQRCPGCPTPTRPDPLAVSINGAGQVRIDGQVLPPSALEAEFQLALRRQPGQGILISIAPSAPYDALVQVLGSAHNSGIRSISFAGN
ncbi:MAG: biopolymer transporter ExbD [Ahniella sp.]|nr:biopolymer transporter ExbD [Ahniella sp.]